ncbi:MAG: hypothetical protein K8S97_13365 [Anaerolineae bacterium]|nr:hypothetical protein [Anaerolineae bacterium]
MPRDDDLPQRRDYRPSDQLAPPQPDRSWRENGNDKTEPVVNPAWEPPGGLHYVSEPELPSDSFAEVQPDSPSDAFAVDGVALDQEYSMMTPPLEPDEVIDPDPDESGVSPAWTPQTTDAPSDDASALRAFPRPADPSVPVDPEGLSVQERYDILLHTIALYQADWKLSRVRAHEESGQLQAFLISRHRPMSIREAHECDQLLIIVVDTEGNTEIREPSGRNLKGWRRRFRGGGDSKPA